MRQKPVNDRCCKQALEPAFRSALPACPCSALASAAFRSGLFARHLPYAAPLPPRLVSDPVVWFGLLTEQPAIYQLSFHFAVFLSSETGCTQLRRSYPLFQQRPPSACISTSPRLSLKSPLCCYLAICPTVIGLPVAKVRSYRLWPVLPLSTRP